MFSSLRFRLWLSYAVIALLVVVITGFAILVFLAKNPPSAKQEIQRLNLISALLLQRGSVYRNFEPENLQNSVVRADEAFKARVAIYDNDGALLADSRAGRAPSLPPAAFFLNKEPGKLPTFRDFQGKAWFYSLRSIDDKGILIVSSLRPQIPVLEIFRNELFKPIIQILIFSLVVALGLAFWIARWITAPLHRMAMAAKTIEQESDQMIPLEGPSEVRSLAASFNEMAERVQTTQRAQRDFVANISHELKTPLTSIQGFSQALLDGTIDSGDEYRSAAKVINEEAGRMNRMINDLLILTRLDAGNLKFVRQSLDLPALLEESVRKFSRSAEKAGVSLVLWSDEFPHEIPGLSGDPDRLTQVFSNILDNAIKYSPSGSNVLIIPEQEPENVSIYFIDNGPGIPITEKDRIFERFYQVDPSRSSRKGRGVGLGLAIALDIVKEHGGTITVFNRNEININNVDSTKSGCVFIVRLPIDNSAD